MICSEFQKGRLKDMFCLFQDEESNTKVNFQSHIISRFAWSFCVFFKQKNAFQKTQLPWIHVVALTLQVSHIGLLTTPRRHWHVWPVTPRKYHCQIIPICHCWWKSSHLRWIRMDDLRATVWITSSVEIPKEYHWTPSTHPHDMRWFIGRYVFQDFSPGSMDDKKALLNPLMNYPQR